MDDFNKRIVSRFTSQSDRKPYNKMVWSAGNTSAAPFPPRFPSVCATRGTVPRKMQSLHGSECAKESQPRRGEIPHPNRTPFEFEPFYMRGVKDKYVGRVDGST